MFVMWKMIFNFQKILVFLEKGYFLCIGNGK